MNAESGVMQGRNLTMFYAAVGLACLFGGIWVGDHEILSASSSSNATLWMRLMTFAVYVAFFFVARWFSRCNKVDLRLFFSAASLIGLVCLFAGVMIVLFVVPAASGEAATSWYMCGLLLTKVVGAPATVLMTYVFALLERADLIRSCAIGMLGAFALYSVSEQTFVNTMSSAIAPAALATVFIGLAVLLGILGLGSPTGRRFMARRESETVPVALAMPGVVKRPLKKVLTPGLVIVLVLSATMLGFVRNGLGSTDPHSNPASLAVLVVLAVVALFWRSLRGEHVFYAALLCTGAGALLRPFLASLVPGLADVLYGIGGALFEVVMWILVAWTARNSIETLEAAAAVRLVAVIGHLLGTVLVFFVVAALAGFSLDESLSAGELLVVFVYLVLVVCQMKMPQLRVPFTEPASLPVDPAAFASTESAIDFDEIKREDPEEFERRMWTEPCDAIATTYKLTAREREVFELIARGRDMPYIEEELVISRNTLKMHTRHIYTKLDAHSKQDVIDIVEAVRE